MRRTKAVALAAVVGTAAAMVLLSPSAASAHEVRTVGAHRFTVGFGSEPAYLGLFPSFIVVLRE